MWFWRVGLCLLLSPLVLGIVWVVAAMWRESKLEGIVFLTLMLGVLLFVFGYFILPEL